MERTEKASPPIIISVILRFFLDHNWMGLSHEHVRRKKRGEKKKSRQRSYWNRRATREEGQTTNVLIFPISSVSNNKMLSTFVASLLTCSETDPPSCEVLIYSQILCLWVWRALPPICCCKAATHYALVPPFFKKKKKKKSYMLHLFTFDELCSCTNLWGKQQAADEHYRLLANPKTLVSCLFWYF